MMFFEDYEEEITLEESNDDLEKYFTEEEENSFIEEDGTSLTQITLESEMSWSNIEKSCILEEFNAIKNEDDDSMNEAKENFFKKALEWIKEKANKVINFFRRLFATMQQKAGQVNNFLSKYEKSLKSAYVASSKTVVYVYKWTKSPMMQIKNTYKDIDKAKDVALKFAKNGESTIDTESICKEMTGKSYKDYKKTVENEYRSEKKVALEIKDGDISKAISVMRTYDKKVSEVNSIKGSMLQNLKNMKDSAKDGLSKNDKEEIKLAKRKITAGKTAGTIADMIASVSISLINTELVDQLVIANATLKAGKKSAKEAETKNESYSFFDLV